MLLQHVTAFLNLLLVLCATATSPGVGRSIQKRQTNRKEILRRATRRLTAKRAYTSPSPCGWTGAFRLQRTSATESFLNEITFAQPLQWGVARGSSRTFTFDSQCRLISQNLVVNTQGTSNELLDLYRNTESSIAGQPNFYSPLRCRVTEDNQLLCTRFASATPGVFCSSSASNAPLKFGGACNAANPSALFTVVDA